MRSIIFSLLLLLFSAPLLAGEYVSDSIKIDGYMRHFRMYLPQGIKQNAPLVFALHGYGNNGTVNKTIPQAADRHGFAVCIPVGLPDPTGKRSWNVGYPMQEGWKVNDARAMCRIARHVQKKYRLSRENTFLCGMSNGGEMCYLLAYSDQKVFRAFGSIAGLTMQWIYDSRSIPRPIPFLEIHGTADKTSLWEGDLQNRGGWNPYVSVPLAVNRLVAAGRCRQLVLDTISFPERKMHRPIVRHRYVDGCDSTEVWLYQVQGAPHSYFTDDMDTGQVLWEFFSKFLK